MPPDPGVVFFLFLVGTIGLAGVAYLVLLIARWTARRVKPHYVTSVRARSVHFEPTVRRYYPSFDPEPEPEPEANAAAERQNSDETGAFALSPDECAAVARMIDHARGAEKPTKASTIWAGFGLKKGASSRYQRASAIYDTLFIAPEQIQTTPIAERTTPARFASDGRR